MKPLSNKTLEERKKEFIARAEKWMYDNDPENKKNPVWLFDEYIIFWTRLSDSGDKMRFESEPKKRRDNWYTGNALATARHIHQYDKRWKTEILGVKQIPTDSPPEPPKEKFDRNKLTKEERKRLDDKMRDIEERAKNKPKEEILIGAGNIGRLVKESWKGQMSNFK